MRKIWLYVIILGIPMIGFVVAEGIQAHFNNKLHESLHKRFPEETESAISTITIDMICKESPSELLDVCQTNWNLNLMSDAALISGAIGLALLLAIRIAGGVSRNNRSLLLILFKPGIYITSIIIIGLIIVSACLAIAVIYYGESVLINRIHVGIIALIGIGALSGISIMAKNLFSLVQKAKTLVIGTSVSREEAPELWGQVDNIADKLGALRPQQIVVGLEPNFFVTEADVACLNGNLSGRTMYCSMPLCRILTTNEFSSVIGHELGHFKGLDTKFSMDFYPIYRGTISAITSLHETGGKGSASIPLLPAIAILSYFLECFSVAESKISRDREFAADMAGSSVTNAATIGTALVKIHAFSGLWSAVQDASLEALNNGKVFTNVSKVYADAVLEHADPKVLEGIAETHLSHPTDSHPPLGARLTALGVSLKGVSGGSLNLSLTEAAIEYIKGYEQKEEEISGAFQIILANRHGIDINEQENEPAST